MEYNKIISVSGMPGLFEMISSRNDGAVVKSLADGSSKFVSSRINNFSQLESIEIFTKKENANLVDVFEAIQQHEDTLPADDADITLIKAYFEKIYADMDFDRVHNSDMKKMVKWYRILKAKDIDIKLSDQPLQDLGDNNMAAKTKQAETKGASLKNAPPKKINTPRKMA
jgi:hypothetical protein